MLIVERQRQAQRDRSVGARRALRAAAAGGARRCRGCASAALSERHAADQQPVGHAHRESRRAVAAGERARRLHERGQPRVLRDLRHADPGRPRFHARRTRSPLRASSSSTRRSRRSTSSGANPIGPPRPQRSESRARPAVEGDRRRGRATRSTTRCATPIPPTMYQRAAQAEKPGPSVDASRSARRRDRRRCSRAASPTRSAASTATSTLTFKPFGDTVRAATSRSASSPCCRRSSAGSRCCWRGSGCTA